MYRVIHDTFLTDPDTRRLSGDAQHLWQDLIIYHHGHVSGLFYVSLDEMVKWAKMPLERIQAALLELEKKQVKYDADNELVWVVSEAKHQPVGQNKWRVIARHLKTIHDSSPLKKAFMDHYSAELQGAGAPRCAVVRLGADMCDPVHKGEGEGKGNKEPLHRNEGVQGEQEVPPSPPKKTRPAKDDQIRDIDLEAYQVKFQLLNVDREFEKWLDWMASKGVTFKKYEAAFRNWLRRAEEKTKPTNDDWRVNR